ncbi:zonadhesin-like [Culicoides brevitarsis]|uniref:zonadhesin-like n=1 Tax=Culicoides brevitarsis TaxID=469753 RepID=UPI00307CA39A
MKSFIPILLVPLFFQASTAHKTVVCEGLNEEYSECASSCNVNCGEKAEMCPAVCKIGCSCKAGHRRSHSGVCVPEEKCDACPGVHEFFNYCGSNCSTTCGEDRMNCPKICVQGCFCKPGYRRSKFNGECVPEAKCQFCTGANEAYATCGNSCNEKCGDDESLCHRMCLEGCFCLPGYKRSLSDGKCVPEDKCFSCTGENEEFTTCGSKCTESCANHQADCKMECRTGCFCKIGFKRNLTTGKCVSQKECPKSTEIVRCGPNEVFKCSNRCLEKIDDGSRVHCFKDTYFACFCRDGFARDPRSMKCVPEAPSRFSYFVPAEWKKYYGIH